MTPDPQPPTPPQSIAMPSPTVWPLVLSVGVALIPTSLAFGYALAAVGAILFLVGLIGWMGQLLPGRGHDHEPLEPRRAEPVVARPGTVEQLKPGLPGYRFRLPEKMHPISAGLKGGLVGGLLMPIPALIWGLVSGKGLFYPVNLLAGLVLPGIQDMGDPELTHFHFGLFVLGVAIHVVLSAGLGLIYGVMLPTLPTIPRPLAWGGLLLPLIWSGVSFALLEVINPALYDRVDWPWFIASQFVFGVVAALVVLQLEKRSSPLAAGAVAGGVAGLVMAIPALVWGLATGHGIWYPVNLLAGTIIPGLGDRPEEVLQRYDTTLFTAALIIHAVFSIGFGVVYALALLKLPRVPGPLSWGGVLMPLLWTGASYGLMSVLNPTMEDKVDWPWFVASQFVFGVAAAVVVQRSEQVHIPPAGPGSPPEDQPL